MAGKNTLSLNYTPAPYPLFLIEFFIGIIIDDIVAKNRSFLYCAQFCLTVTFYRVIQYTKGLKGMKPPL